MLEPDQIREKNTVSIQQPISTDPLNLPDHSLSHRVFANDDASPVQSVVVDANGDTTITYRLMQPMGEVSYFSTTGTVVTIAAQSNGSTNMVVVSPASTFVNDSGFDNGGSNNGRLRYTGATTRMFHVACTISIAPAAANDTFVFGVAKNGTVVASSKVLIKATNALDARSTAMHVMVELATNDYLELYVGNTTDADDVTVLTLNLFAMGM